MGEVGTQRNQSVPALGFVAVIDVNAFVELFLDPTFASHLMLLLLTFDDDDHDDDGDDYHY